MNAALLAAVAVMPQPTGDPAGIALFAKIERAYRSVPAVVMTGHSGSLRVRFQVVLQHGVVVAEEFVGTSPAGTGILVARKQGRTFSRDPGRRCWRAVAPTDPQALEDVGLRFPESYRTRVGRPQRSGATWLLPVTTSGRFSSSSGHGTFVVDARTLRLRSAIAPAASGRIVETIRAVTNVPRLPLPQPRC